MASPTVLMFSASSSGISTSNSSSIAITSSTMSRLSAPRSSMKEDSALISSSPTPSWSAMMDLTFASMFVADMASLHNAAGLDLRAAYRALAAFGTTRNDLHVHATVDLQNLSRDVRGIGRREEHGGSRDLLGLAQAR